MAQAAKRGNAETPFRRRDIVDVNRRRIVEAMIELVREGDYAPSADAVAARAQVGRRTVFRLFNDLEGVYHEMNAIMVGRLSPLLEQPAPGTPWGEALTLLVDRRARMFEEMLPLKSAADAVRHRSPMLQANHERMVRTLRAPLLDSAPAKARADRVLMDALEAALSFETWRRLRVDQRLTKPQARAVFARLAGALAGVPVSP